MHIRASTSGSRRVALGVVAALTFAWLTAAQAQSCEPDSVARECLQQRSQDEFQQADDELNRTYQKVLKAMSRPHDEYVNYPALKVKFVEAQRQWIRFLDNECAAWYLINEAGADRNLDLLTCEIDRTRDRTRQLKAWLEQIGHG
ncbi:lysozyme inhibitor LprI family protein [Burkholderia pseudomultivorans]|uniref:lysozyme inhibitor LprI family protein n=1 Tax=Burkholderia pseudomultivorans TaxID=1207504 RepID=UPI001E42E44D|nr:lysozyme inhibitor LprI family protein [Burkholderia pseudomultivorans]